MKKCGMQSAECGTTENAGSQESVSIHVHPWLKIFRRVRNEELPTTLVRWLVGWLASSGTLLIPHLLNEVKNGHKKTQKGNEQKSTFYVPFVRSCGHLRQAYLGPFTGARVCDPQQLRLSRRAQNLFGRPENFGIAAAHRAALQRRLVAISTPFLL